MDIDKEIFWYEINQVFLGRLVGHACLFEEERLTRIEELMFLRDQLKSLWESKSDHERY